MRLSLTCGCRTASADLPARAVEFCGAGTSKGGTTSRHIEKTRITARSRSSELFLSTRHCSRHEIRLNYPNCSSSACNAPSPLTPCTPYRTAAKSKLNAGYPPGCGISHIQLTLASFFRATTMQNGPPACCSFVLTFCQYQLQQRTAYAYTHQAHCFTVASVVPSPSQTEFPKNHTLPSARSLVVCPRTANSSQTPWSFLYPPGRTQASQRPLLQPLPSLVSLHAPSLPSCRRLGLTAALQSGSRHLLQQQRAH